MLILGLQKYTFSNFLMFEFDPKTKSKEGVNFSTKLDI